MTYDEWLYRWQGLIPTQALQELHAVLTRPENPPERNHGDPRSEAAVQAAGVLALSDLGALVYRNNVGVLKDVNGRPVRYGLANETPNMNKVLKSGDYIGAMPYVVQPYDVGRTLGVFLSVEFKPADWHYTGKGREQAQLNWQTAYNRIGGVAFFANSTQSIIDSLDNKRLLSPQAIQGLRL